MEEINEKRKILVGEYKNVPVQKKRKQSEKKQKEITAVESKTVESDVIFSIFFSFYHTCTVIYYIHYYLIQEYH